MLFFESFFFCIRQLIQIQKEYSKNEHPNNFWRFLFWRILNNIELICSLCWTRRGQQGGLGEWAMNMDEEIHTHTKLHCAHYCILQKHCLVTSNSLCNVTFFNNFCKKPPENYAVTSLCYIDKNNNSSWPGKDGQNTALCTGQNSPGSSLNIEMEILCSSIYTAATWRERELPSNACN